MTASRQDVDGQSDVVPRLSGSDSLEIRLALAVGGARRRLPLLDRSLLPLLQALVADDDRPLAGRLAEVATLDPALAAWLLANDVSDASADLDESPQDCARSELDWHERLHRDLCTIELDQTLQGAWADHCVRAIAVARSVLADIPALSPNARMRLRLTAICRQAFQGQPDLSESLPTVAPEHELLVCRAVEAATADPEGFCTCWTSSDERSAWRQSSPELRVLVPSLVDRLRRAGQLQVAFEERLEHEKLLAMKELAYGASHEINNPLANISSRAQVLLRDELDPERRRSLATINSQAFRAHEMIADMMLFAKPPQLQLQLVDLASFLRDVIAEVERDYGERVEVRLGGQLPAFACEFDPQQMSVALRAVCRNSVEAMGEGGTLTISTRVRSMPTWLSEKEAERWLSTADEFATVEIEIRDTGPGISPAVRRHLFDPFYSGREAGRGLGFGLSKAWRIVTSHGGQIVASNTDAGVEPAGATITFLLPVRSHPRPDR